jgi:hypothetical protein
VTVTTDSQKRFLAMGLLVVLLILALPIAPLFLPKSLRDGIRMSQLMAKKDPFANIPCEGTKDVDACNFMLPTKPGPQQEKHRQAALKVVNRWESESRVKGGKASVSPIDLQRLRKAIQSENS